MKHTLRSFLVPLALAAVAIAPSASARQSDGLMPHGELQSDVALSEEEGIDVVQKLDAALPRELEFTNADGKVLKIGDLFDGKRPVLLTFNYSSCPMLCSLQLQAMVDSLTQVELTPGEDYRVVTVLIDPLETWKRARATKNKWKEQWSKPGVEEGWEFLVNSDTDVIHALADSVGFQYRYVPSTGEYSHRAAMMVITPKGKVSRYFAGIDYPPIDVRRALVDAADGTIGSLTDHLFLWCFQYLPSENRYVMFAANFMKLGGAVMVLVLGAFFFFMARYEKAHRRVATGHDAGSKS